MTANSSHPLREPPAYQRIEDSLRAEILSGRLAYGSRLPAAQELAAQYGTRVFTIQSALSPLVQWAASLIEQLKQQVAGRQVQPVFLPAFLNPTSLPKP